MPSPNTTHHYWLSPATTHNHPPLFTTTQNNPKVLTTIYHNPPSVKICTTTHHHPKNEPPPAKSKISSYISTFWHCFESFFFFKTQNSYTWRRFCMINFWLVGLSNSKTLLQFMIFKFIFQEFKVGISPSKKICVICSIESPLKLMKNVFNFILNAFFVLKMFRLLSRLFGHAEKTAWLERKRLTSKFMTSQPDLQLQYIYCPISHKVKVTRQWNLVS